MRIELSRARSFPESEGIPNDLTASLMTFLRLLRVVFLLKRSGATDNSSRIATRISEVVSVEE